MPRYELSDGSSNKFWDITLDGKSFKVTFGKIGANGQTQLKSFKTPAEAKTAHDKLVAEKTKKGYVFVGKAKAKPNGKPEKAAKATPAAAAKRNPELEKAIDANPEDADAYSVLADWLQDQGDPRGELIALQLANKAKPAAKLIEKHAEHFLGPLAAHQKTYDGKDEDAFTWKFGFIHGAKLSHDHYANEEFEGKLVDVLGALLAHPSGRFLTEISFAFNNDPNEDDCQDLIDLLAKKAPPTIRNLFFGDYSFAGGYHVRDIVGAGNDTEISWYSVGNLSKLWKAVPRLERLIIQGGSSESALGGGVTIGKLDLPSLKHFEMRTGGLEKANARAIAKAGIPNIEHLEIWYGDDSYGGDATIKDVMALTERTDLTKLRHLGLRNALFTDEMPFALARSPMLPRLKSLDLSLGCMTDAGAKELADRKAVFAHLDVLNISKNYLTKAGVASLKGVAKKIINTDQREQDDPEYRNTAVAE